MLAEYGNRGLKPSDIRLKATRSPFRKSSIPGVVSKAVPLVLAVALGAGSVWGAHRLITDISNADAEQETSSWAQDVSRTLKGEQKPLKTDKFYEKGKIVAAGADLEDRFEMQRNKVPVIVRDYPALEHENGVATHVVGVIGQGEEISNFMLVRDESVARYGQWAAFQCDLAKDKIQPANGKPVEIPKEGVCVIRSDYVDSSAKKK